MSQYLGGRQAVRRAAAAVRSRTSADEGRGVRGAKRSERLDASGASKPRASAVLCGAVSGLCGECQQFYRERTK